MLLLVFVSSSSCFLASQRVFSPGKILESQVLHLHKTCVKLGHPKGMVDPIQENLDFHRQEKKKAARPG